MLTRRHHHAWTHGHDDSVATHPPPRDDPARLSTLLGPAGDVVPHHRVARLRRRFGGTKIELDLGQHVVLRQGFPSPPQ
jgi:hypothetical protein